jgi:hypothetical protein
VQEGQGSPGRTTFAGRSVPTISKDIRLLEDGDFTVAWMENHTMRLRFNEKYIHLKYKNH